MSKLNHLTPASGYDLIANFDGTYSFYLNGLLDVKGAQVDVVKHMVLVRGIKEEEVLSAITDMSNTDCDRAHFGSFRRFMFASNEPIEGQGYVV